MYKIVMLDGEEIKIRTDIDEKQTGKIIFQDLEKTDDLSEVVDYINESQIGGENNE